MMAGADGARVAVYLRVSTAEQDTDPQARDVREFCDRRGWTISATYVDHGVSGAKARRPGLDRLLKEAVWPRTVDAVVAWDLSRVARSTAHALDVMETFRRAGVRLVFVRQPELDPESATGRAMFGLLAIFAELERALTVERIKAGLRAAQARGVRLGAPPKITDALAAEAAARRARGASYGAIAKAMGVPKTTVFAAVQKGRAGAPAQVPVPSSPPAAA